jgi:carboxymethylenebutenolidase
LLGRRASVRIRDRDPKLKAAYVFYGDAPSEVGKITCPVYGFYAGNDERVNATIPEAERLMKATGKKYEPVIYKDAGHGFMREGEMPDASQANKNAREDAWTRWKELLKDLK